MPEVVARNAFGAGALYAARNGGPEQLRKNLARVIGVHARRGARRADPCFAGLLRAILAGGFPACRRWITRRWAASFPWPGRRAPLGSAGRRPGRGAGAAAQR